MPIRFVICDDDPFFRSFLRMLLAGQNNFTLVAEGASGAEAVTLCREYKPDLLLIDIQMESECDGIDAIKEIRAFDEDLRIVVLTVYGNEAYIVNAFRNGADNFLCKEQSAQEIMETIQDVLTVRPRLSQNVAHALKSYVARTSERERQAETNYKQAVEILSMLTKTELEILILLRQGYTREGIAQKKVVELGTIKTHINRILKKFNVRRTSVVLQRLESIDFFRYIDEQMITGHQED